MELFGKHPVPLRTALHEVHEKFKFICNQSSAIEVCIISEIVRSTNQLCKFCAEKKKQYLSWAMILKNMYICFLSVKKCSLTDGKKFFERNNCNIKD